MCVLVGHIIHDMYWVELQDWPGHLGLGAIVSTVDASPLSPAAVFPTPAPCVDALVPAVCLLLRCFPKFPAGRKQRK